MQRPLAPSGSRRARTHTLSLCRQGLGFLALSEQDALSAPGNADNISSSQSKAFHGQLTGVKYACTIAPP